MHDYPKILIFGPPFNNFSGSGITLTNLFWGWPKDRIAVTSIGQVFQGLTTDVCDTYYLLGKEEHKWIFPLNHLQRSFPSGLVSFEKKGNKSQPAHKKSLRRFLVDKLFYPFIRWLGFFHWFSSITLSPQFKDWLELFQPEILYIQVTSREDVLFSIQLCDFLKIPSVIHNMDDWPSTISRKGLFKRYWWKKIDNEFRQLLDRNDLYLSISDAMTSEYLKRYNKVFKAFHNPIDISKYNHVRNRPAEGVRKFRILYTGRVGLANEKSIYLFASVISQLKIEQFNIEMDIFTYNTHSWGLKKIGNLKNVRILPFVEHDMIPSLLAEYDLLFLPLDFTDAGFKYAQYSLPTKASEYMISGTPILVFAPEETAISKFCSDNECGYCVSVRSKKKITEAIHFLINNEDYRIQISQNAVRLATELFDANKVRNRFQQLLMNLARN